MERKTIKLFVLEDDELDRMAIERFFREENLLYNVTFAESISDGRELLSLNTYDAVLLDYYLEDGVCFDLFECVGADTAIVVVTGLGNEDVAVQALRSGATDYIVKDNEGKYIREIPVAISNSILRKQWVRESSMFKQVFNSSADLMTLVNREYVYTNVNDAYLRAHARTREEIEGKPVWEVLGTESFKKVVKAKLDEAFAGQIILYQEWFNLKGLGACFLEVAFSPYYDVDGKISGAVINVRDKTESKKLEDELQMVRHLEALGGLAAGIAHQFNNTLAIILGNVEGAEMELADRQDLDCYWEPIHGAIQRMTGLTQQLLAHARGGKYSSQLVSMNELIRECLSDKKNAINKDSRIETELSEEDCLVEIDEIQMKYVIEAILQNSIDSFEHDGMIRIVSSQTRINEREKTLAGGLKTGPYVKITLSDNGSGIDPDLLPRVFEPFFTTKFIGRGLGLAAVYGIITNHNGWIGIESKPGEGTTVTILLPSVEKS